MGYTTDFIGEFQISPNLNKKHFDFLTAFSTTRHFKRNVDSKYGIEGSLYTEDCFNEDKNLIINYNEPPTGQPGLWCQWVPEVSNEKSVLVWDGNDKFYDYIEWLEYLIKTFFIPWGYFLNGQVEWQGEESDDFGKIILENNKVIIKNGKKIFE